MTVCIRQFSSNLFYVGLSSLYLKLAKNAWKHHKLKSSVNIFPQIRFMGIFNMSFMIPFCIKLHKKSFDIIFFRVQPFFYSPIDLFLGSDRVALEWRMRRARKTQQITSRLDEPVALACVRRLHSHFEPCSKEMDAR